MAASPVCLLLPPPPKYPLPSITIVTPAAAFGSGRNLSVSSYHLFRRHIHIPHRFMMGRAPNCSNKVDEADIESPLLDCVGTNADVECVVKEDSNSDVSDVSLSLLDWVLLIFPFFFWGTAMVAMKQVLPKTGPFFVAAVRLIPAGAILVSFALFKGRPLPSGLIAWLSIALFGLVDATCFQGFLAQGLLRTSAGLGSVIIDSQPLTVAILAALLFGESLGLVGITGLVLGVIGLLLLEVPTISLDHDFSLVGSGELWMLLAAQSMAVGTVMVRWVSKYSDPVMATGWHMIIGGLPIVIISVLNHEPALQGSLIELSTNDVIALVYTSIFGSAISYGLYFYNATRGSLTKLSSLTFLTPMFASLFGFLYLGETFTPLQCVGALVTIAAIYMVNFIDDAAVQFYSQLFRGHARPPPPVLVGLFERLIPGEAKLRCARSIHENIARRKRWNGLEEGGKRLEVKLEGQVKVNVIAVELENQTEKSQPHKIWRAKVLHEENLEDDSEKACDASRNQKPDGKKKIEIQAVEENQSWLRRCVVEKTKNMVSLGELEEKLIIMNIIPTSIYSMGALKSDKKKLGCTEPQTRASKRDENSKLDCRTESITPQGREELGEPKESSNWKETKKAGDEKSWASLLKGDNESGGPNIGKHILKENQQKIVFVYQKRCKQSCRTADAIWMCKALRKEQERKDIDPREVIKGLATETVRVEEIRGKQETGKKTGLGRWQCKSRRRYFPRGSLQDSKINES
ncbi:unnamed protein product [Rhodiola kirilowii]